MYSKTSVSRLRIRSDSQELAYLSTSFKITQYLTVFFKTSVEQFTILTGIAAGDGSRELAYLSTASYVGGLNFRVRNGSGCDTTAMAANVRLRS